MTNRNLPDDKMIIAITGGSGFLGQHLVKQIENTSPHLIKEIRIMDRRPFHKFIDFEDNIIIKCLIGDCTNVEFVESCLVDCSVVYNLAAKKYPLSLITNDEEFKRDNIDATETVLSACRKLNVQNFIHVGSAISTIEPYDSFGHSELITVNKPKSTQFGIYASSKFDGELIVHDYCTKLMANGKPLRTMVIRLGFLYGEGDSTLVPYSLKVCKQFGYLPYIGSGRAGMFQMTYAGNAAAALVKACSQLISRPNEFNGETIFCSENTMGIKFYEFIEPFVEAGGFKIGKPLPYFSTVASSWIIHKVCDLTRVLSFGRLKLGYNIPDYQLIRILGGRYFNFSNIKCRCFLDFVPEYNGEEAMNDTILWWKDHITHKDKKLCQSNVKNIKL